jgi:predicted alpha/beta-fold hydrolase
MIWLFVFLVFLAFLFYRWLCNQLKINVHVNMDGEMAAVVSSMTSIKHPYVPTPWLIGKHMQTIWGMRYRRTFPKCRREMFKFCDGGQCALDFYDPIADNPPILMIIHTLAGGTREPCSNNLAEAARRQGYRAFVYNNRGCSGVEFTSPTFYNVLILDDVRDVIEYVKSKYSHSFFFLHGFSLGGYTALGYAAGEGKVDAVSAVSHTYNGNVANGCLEKFVQKRLYLPVMMTKLTRMFAKNHFVDYPGAVKATNLEEFDENYTCKVYDIPSAYEYYERSAIHAQIPKLKTLTLLLGADNDPFTESRIQPRREAELSERFAFLHVKEGGHVGFPKGWKADGSLIEDVILDFYSAVRKLKT